MIRVLRLMGMGMCIFWIAQIVWLVGGNHPSIYTVFHAMVTAVIYYVVATLLLMSSKP